LPSNHILKKIANRHIIEIGEMDHLKDYEIILKKRS